MGWVCGEPRSGRVKKRSFQTGFLQNIWSECVVIGLLRVRFAAGWMILIGRGREGEAACLGREKLDIRPCGNIKGACECIILVCCPHTFPV